MSSFRNLPTHRMALGNLTLAPGESAVLVAQPESGVERFHPTHLDVRSGGGIRVYGILAGKNTPALVSVTNRADGIIEFEVEMHVQPISHEQTFSVRVENLSALLPTVVAVVVVGKAEMRDA